MDLVQKLTLLRDNGADIIDCSSVFAGDTGSLNFQLTRAEYCHALEALAEWDETRKREPVTKKAEQQYVNARKHFKNFDAIVGRFNRKFDMDRLAFDLFDYGNRLGILVRKGFDGAKLLIMFDSRDGVEVVDACVRFAQRWDSGETEFKGIPVDYISEGNEVSARSIFSGETK